MIYDISQPVFGCEVYPGDPSPERKILCSMENGDAYDLTAFSMCAHNGTHVDAPGHFIRGGKSIDRIGLDKTTGPAYVAAHEGPLGAEDARAILCRAALARKGADKRILIKGNAVLTPEGAREFAAAETCLFGNESITVGPVEAPVAVHLILLGAEVIPLEGIRLSHVPEGAYYLFCAPLNLTGAEGAPCRAVLTDDL